MKNELVSKFTLSTGKVVYLKEGQIEDLENATKVAGRNFDENNKLSSGMEVQKELAKSLLVGIEIDGVFKKLSLTEKQMLNKYFNLKEYSQLLKATQMVAGDLDEGKALTPEFVTMPDSAKTNENSGNKLPGANDTQVSASKKLEG